MKKKAAIGLLEINSIAAGVEVINMVVKSSNIELIQALPVCPGKYIAMFYGDVGSIQSAVEAGEEAAGEYLVDKFILANVHDEVLPALTATSQVDKIEALGIIETFSVASGIVAADAAAKTAQVTLLEVRTARGMGGKSVVFFTGDVGSVSMAVESAARTAADEGLLVNKTVIPQVHEDLWEKLL